MIYYFIVSLTLSVLLVVLNSGLGKKSSYSREKASAFECGFDPKTMTRLPFSLHFFLIALIFLIFDVEITLILPFPLVTAKAVDTIVTGVFLFFVILLLAGVLLEWKGGALEWAK